MRAYGDLDLDITLHDGRRPQRPRYYAYTFLCQLQSTLVIMASSLDEVDLATQGHVAWATFQVAFETLEKNVSTFSKQPNAAGLRSEMQRFQLWAINLGLLRQDHSSLDYRLRDNEVVKSFTTELLTSLIEALQESRSS